MLAHTEEQQKVYAEYIQECESRRRHQEVERLVVGIYSLGGAAIVIVVLVVCVATGLIHF